MHGVRDGVSIRCTGQVPLEFTLQRVRVLARLLAQAKAVTIQLAKGSPWGCACGHMKKTCKHADVSAPQTVTEFIKLVTGSEAIQIGFTDQRVSAHAGLATFAGFLHRSEERRVGKE